MKNNLLPHYCKIVGLAVFLFAFFIPIILGMLHPQSWDQTEGRRQIANTVMLIGLLLFILSREKAEDEFINHCRLIAFRAAFIAGMVYFLHDALSTFKVHFLHSAFGLLVMEIGVYVFVFYFAKAGLINGK